LQRLVTGRRTWQCPDLQTQARADLLDHRLLQGRGNDLQLAATVRTLLQVETRYVAALKAIDASVLAGSPDFGPLHVLMMEWLGKQLNGVTHPPEQPKGVETAIQPPDASKRVEPTEAPQPGPDLPDEAT
jgi:hypothetical protein